MSTIGRKYLLLPLLILLAALSATTATAGSYCTPSGDYCTSAAKRGGKVLLQLSTFSFKGKYKLCVTGPTAAESCKSFKLSKSGSLYKSSIQWSKHFPDQGAGTYYVIWKLGSTQLGSELNFRVTASQNSS